MYIFSLNAIIYKKITLKLLMLLIKKAFQDWDQLI
jgi:hypothetical protein